MLLLGLVIDVLLVAEHVLGLIIDEAPLQKVASRLASCLTSLELFDKRIIADTTFQSQVQAVNASKQVLVVGVARLLKERWRDFPGRWSLATHDV